MIESTSHSDENPYEPPRSGDSPLRSSYRFSGAVHLLAFVLHLASGACIIFGISGTFFGAVVTFAEPWTTVGPIVCVAGGAMLFLLGIAMRFIYHHF